MQFFITPRSFEFEQMTVKCMKKIQNHIDVLYTLKTSKAPLFGKTAGLYGFVGRHVCRVSHQLVRKTLVISSNNRKYISSASRKVTKAKVGTRVMGCGGKTSSPMK